jgi:NAD(P)-dependent dehydrogenase (short-subunit alcohol dehydrogenase family)
MAERFAREGMKIVVADIEQAPLDQAEREMRESATNVIGVRTDVLHEGLGDSCFLFTSAQQRRSGSFCRRHAGDRSAGVRD